MNSLEIDAAAERATGERLYHVIIVRVHQRTGERIGNVKTYLTGYPMTHKHCMTFASKWTPRNGPGYRTAWRLEEMT